MVTFRCLVWEMKLNWFNHLTLNSVEFQSNKNHRIKYSSIDPCNKGVWASTIHELKDWARFVKNKSQRTREDNIGLMLQDQQQPPNTRSQRATRSIIGTYKIPACSCSVLGQREERERRAEVRGSPSREIQRGDSRLWASKVFRVVSSIWRNYLVRHIAWIFLSREPVRSIPFSNQTRERPPGTGPTHYVPLRSSNWTHP